MNDKMTYQEALDWIHGKLSFGIKPGLERMKWMLNELGNPQNQIKAVHVVGTNGKGSTVNYLQNVFTQSGYHVGTFTSPYIVDFKERISLDGQMISESDFLDLVNTVAPVIERLPLETGLEAATEFEVITVLMFYYFGVMHPVDLAVIEAGLGGRYDSTNVFTPLALVCPSIGLDHQAILGNSHVAIAEQKVGALKQGIPFVYATDRSDVQDVFEERASYLNSPTLRLDRDFAYQQSENTFSFALTEKGRQNLSKFSRADRLLDKTNQLSSLTLAMVGQHQVANTSLAIMTSLLLQEYYPKLNSEHLRNALSESRWLGRTEFLRDNLMIDGAHNNESIAVLVDLLKDKYVDRAVHILFAAIDTKPVEEMLVQLDHFASLTVTTFPYPNSLKLADYPADCQKVSDFQTWLDEVYQPNPDDLYVITGSLYFISQVRQSLLKQPIDDR